MLSLVLYMAGQPANAAVSNAMVTILFLIRDAIALARLFLPLAHHRMLYNNLTKISIDIRLTAEVVGIAIGMRA